MNVNNAYSAQRTNPTFSLPSGQSETLQRSKLRRAEIHFRSRQFTHLSPTFHSHGGNVTRMLMSSTSTSTPIHETVARLGRQRGAPRYFVNTRYLDRAGFQHGQWLSFQIGDGTLTISVAEAPTGKRVQEKNGHPLIDLNAKFLAQVFPQTSTIHVRVNERQIVLSAHPLDHATHDRPRDRSMASVFSGAGMLDQAGVTAGFECKWGIEIDRRVADVFAENHPRATVYEMSAHEAAFTNLRPVELLVMGLPCQPWSTARTLNSDGSKRDRSRPATEHPLGDMALWAFLIIARVNPRTIVLECAPAFKDNELWASLTGALQRFGYKVDSRVLNSFEFGAFSARRRTVLVATTPDPDSEPVDPWPTPLPEGARRRTFSEFADSEVGESDFWDRATKSWVFRCNERNAAKGNGFGFQVVRSDSVKCGVLTAEYGQVKNDQPVVAHPTRPDCYRYLTIREGRSIFGLPDSYVLPKAKGFAWQLLGQGVYVPLFTAIIRQATTTCPKSAASNDELLAELRSSTN